MKLTTSKLGLVPLMGLLLLNVPGLVRFSSAQGNKGAADSLNAEDFGVLCDGTTDDTAALSRAVQTASKLQTKLTIQAGTCIVSPSKNQVLPIASNVWIQGSGYATVLKVKDGTGAYNAFFGPYGAANITNFMLTDLTIDQNTLKAIPYSPANFRMVVGTAPGGGFLTIERVHVTNVEGINTFYSATPYTTIRDCVLDLIGGSGVPHDYSALYIAAEHSVVANNIFTARTVGSAVTAIETHGGKHTITGNVIDGLATGMNITGVAAAESSGIVVSGNSISNADFGIFLYSFATGSHTTGYGINGAIITGNSIRITQNAAAYAGFNSNTGGIILYPNAKLPVLPYKDVLISNNIIEFDSQSKFNNPAGFGIGYWDSAGGNTVTNLRILNNTILNCPMPGIRFSAEGSDIEVSGNQIVNPGSSLGVLANSLRAGIFFASKLPIHNLRVLNNNITDNQPVTQMSYGIEFLTGNVGDIVARGNTTSVTGDGRKFLFATGALTNTQLPLINDTVYAPHNLLALPSSSSQQGSTMINAATGVTYSVAAGLTTWKATVRGTAPPIAGNWSAGDFMWNDLPLGASPIAGSPIVLGWVCTASGTPGVWIPINIVDFQNHAARIYGGIGSPNGVVKAVPGSVYLNSAGGPLTSFYVKESGTGNTGWVAK